ncbi:single-stranded DNA-binding protein [candidate division WWE3 bacterium]|nr:single-stranded DNA-binding protein [candidate division WWE3 bacterium]
MAGRSLNKVMLIGNLTRDPELRYTASGTAVVSFSVATNRSYTPTNASEAVEDVEFHNIVAWAKLAELCDKLLSKGKKVYIEGRLQTRDWTDEQSGKKMYRTEIIAEEMMILSGTGTREDNGPAAGGNDSAPDINQAANSDFNDEIPF